MTADIDISISDGVQVMRFLRAHKKNAFTGAMYDAMSAALDAAASNDAVVCHIFIGSDGVFSGGNDINDFLRRAGAPSTRGQGLPGPPPAFLRRPPPGKQPRIADVA